MHEIGLNCPKCGYSLTGLTRDICPECGTTFDLERLRDDPEFRRLGTPVYRKRGVELIPRTLQTLLLMLFRPKSFALRLRTDEPLYPAAVVLLIAISPTLWIILGCPTWNNIFAISWRSRLTYAWHGIVVVVVAIVLLVLAVALVFAACSTRGKSRGWAFPRRFRFWCTVALYTTIFLPFWPWFCAGIHSLGWRDYSTDWPFFYTYFHRDTFPATIVLLWWTFIISVVLWYRNRPRWLAIILMLGAFLFVRSSVQFADISIPRLSR